MTLMLLQRINLVPQKPLSEKIKQVTPWIASSLLVGVVALIFVQYHLVNSRLTDNEKQLATLKSRHDQTTRLQAEMAVSRRKAEARRRNYNELKARISKLSVPRVEKNRFSQVLSRITKVIPATVTFDVISFNNKIGMISGIATGPKDLPDFVKNLKKEPVFKDVALLNIARDFADDNQYRLFFNIKFELM